jgi:hypothetical protein
MRTTRRDTEVAKILDVGHPVFFTEEPANRSAGDRDVLPRQSPAGDASRVEICF